MINDEGSIELSKHCFDMCETLETAIQGKGVGDLSEPMKMALEDSERCVNWS